MRLLEFASYNNLKVVNTFGPHKPSRRWTWHSPGGDYHNQIDYTGSVLLPLQQWGDHPQPGGSPRGG